MKRIEAFLQPHRLTHVMHKLHELPRFPGLTVIDAHGQGHGRGAGGHFMYDEQCLIYHGRKLLIVICEDAEASAIAQVIASAAHTGNPGDGIVAVSKIADLLRIRDVRDFTATPAPEAPQSGGGA
jgi:nitrogen regulatory protein P-II 1